MLWRYRWKKRHLSWCEDVRCQRRRRKHHDAQCWQQCFARELKADSQLLTQPRRAKAHEQPACLTPNADVDLRLLHHHPGACFSRSSGVLPSLELTPRENVRRAPLGLHGHDKTPTLASAQLHHHYEFWLTWYRGEDRLFRLGKFPSRRASNNKISCRTWKAHTIAQHRRQRCTPSPVKTRQTHIDSDKGQRTNERHDFTHKICQSSSAQIIVKGNTSETGGRQVQRSGS